MGNQFVDIRAEQLGRLVTELKRAPKELRRELYAGANRATKPVRADMQANIAPATTPTSGGLTSLMVSTTKLSTYLKPGKWPGAGIRVRGRGSLGAMNARGRFRHPRRGDGKWVDQTAGVTKGLLDVPFEKGEPDARRELLQAIDRVAAILYRRT
jgi:hypothetical protein